MNLESTMVSLRRHKRLRSCSGSSSGLAPPIGFCDNGTALSTSTLEKPDNVHLAPSNNVNQSEERQKAAFLASKEAEKAAASLKTLEYQIAEERRLWGEARSKLEADLCNSRARLVAVESDLCNSQARLVAVESDLCNSQVRLDLCNSRARLVAVAVEAVESELKVSKESLANVQRDFHDAQEAWEVMFEEALADIRDDHEQEKARLIEMLTAKPIKAEEPTQASPPQAIPQDFRGQTNKGPNEVSNT